MPVDPATMPVSKGLGEVILKDRPCSKCGYSLRGLETGGVCPECGTPITNRKKSLRFADHLIDAPVWYLKLLAGGLGAMAAVVVGVGASWLAVWVGTIPPGAGSAVGGLLSLVWLGASWAVTIRRPRGDRTNRDEILDSEAIRWAARGAQGLWVLASGMQALWLLTGWAALGVLGGLLTLAAMYGLVPLAIYLSSLADWSGDMGIGNRMRASAWCIAVCGTLLLALSVLMMLPTGLVGLLAIAVPLLSIAVLIGLLLFCISIIQLSLNAVWAIRNWVEARDREIRMEEKTRRRAAADAARADAALAALAEADAERVKRIEKAEREAGKGGAIPLAGGEASKPAIRHHPGLNRPAQPREKEAVTPYDLAPEEEEGSGPGPSETSPSEPRPSEPKQDAI